MSGGGDGFQFFLIYDDGWGGLTSKGFTKRDDLVRWAKENRVYWGKIVEADELHEL